MDTGGKLVAFANPIAALVFGDVAAWIILTDSVATFILGDLDAV